MVRPPRFHHFLDGTVSDEEQNSPSDQPAAEGKRPLVSLPFLAVVVILAAIAYLAGPWIMTQVMLQEENAKAKIVQTPEEVQSARGSIGGAGPPGGGDASAAESGDEEPPAE